MSTEQPPAIVTPPSQVLSDYVELGYLSLFFLIGAPLNAVAFVLLGSRKGQGSDRLFHLKRHLNYSDLLVVLVFTPTRIFWLVTYDWRIGPIACKVIKFLHTFSFQISSNVIVCIAVDRLFSVLKPNAAARRNKRVFGMIITAWVAAAVTCAPQLFVFDTVEVLPQWEQCSPIWEIARLRRSDSNSTFVSLELLYGVGHVTCLFWLPVLLVAVCYVLISCWVCRNGNVTLIEIKKLPEITLQQDDGARAVPIIVGTPPNSELLPKKFSNRHSAPNGSLSAPMTPLLQMALKKNSANTLSPSSTPSKRSLGGSQSLPTGPTNSLLSTPKRLSEASSKSYSMMEDSCVYLKDVRRVKRKTVRLSCLLVLAYVVCWLPYGFLTSWKLIHSTSFVAYSDYLYWLHGLVVFNSVINPFLYCMFGKVVRSR